ATDSEVLAVGSVRLTDMAAAVSAHRSRGLVDSNEPSIWLEANCGEAITCATRSSFWYAITRFIVVFSDASAASNVVIRVICSTTYSAVCFFDNAPQQYRTHTLLSDRSGRGSPVCLSRSAFWPSI